ncbi:ras guanine nucleotide exchange factor a [Anaeramoeba flamelloides]|uniref:Ras guanine nucleotide exchange factor a n=1 Tax=Anaeramoeba flamelloides TaxID=1746091 RepID=A0ABQ8Z657_9EUKA|nr:ras guanine nucleotide exchange factor a [Anaeramoeba flamelloides]
MPFEFPEEPTEAPPTYLLKNQLPNFEKLNTKTGPAKILIKKPKVDRSDWKNQVLNKHKGLANLRERLFPLSRTVKFAQVFNPVEKEVKQKFDSTHVLQLIMHHMVALGYRNTSRIIEVESGVKYKPQYLNDSRLHTIIRSAVKKTEKVYDLTLQDPEKLIKIREQSQKNKQNEQENEENEEKDIEVIEHFVNIGLNDEFEEEENDINIWDEPEGEKYLILSSEKGKDGKQHIKAATLNKIVEKLTNPSGVSMDYIQTCLMTYQSFTSSHNFLIKLIERFKVPKLRTENEDEYSKKKNSVQIRVGNAIKIWIDKYLENPDEQVLQYLQRFLEGDVMEQHPKMANQLLTKLKALKERNGEINIKKYKGTPPEPIIPKNIFFTKT